MAYNVRSAPKMKSVRSKAEPGKRDAILNATLELGVERGFHDAPRSVLAKKGGSQRWNYLSLFLRQRRTHPPKEPPDRLSIRFDQIRETDP
jgi:hypothetical protein